MKTLFLFIRILILSIAFLCSDLAYATLTAHLQRGEKIIEHAVPGRNAEVCIIPKHFTDADYADKDAKSEQELCDIDVNTNAAVCPKLNSTNPGLDIYSIPQGLTANKIEAANCKIADAKKIAKYKLSTSCSYTPSILGYYHVSRILGRIANVPPAVLRTFDLQKHIALGRKALTKTAPDSLIHKTWSSLMTQLTAPSKSSKRDLLFTDDFTQSFGALSLNPKNEAFYKEFFNSGSNNVARAQNFRDKNPIIALLARNDDISKLVGRSFTAENVQKMVQLKDAADLIVIDTLMNQQDRFGNIHYFDTFYYLDTKELNPDGSAKLKSSKKLTPQESAQLGAVQVKEMILKDNDCGVAKQNIAKQTGLADRISHIDPNTYRRLLQFDTVADKAVTKQFFVQGLYFTANDFISIRKNLKDLATKLHQACSSGHLKLDLDLQAHFSKQALKTTSCDL
jgi:hypothetical protein